MVHAYGGGGGSNDNGSGDGCSNATHIIILTIISTHTHTPSRHMEKKIASPASRAERDETKTQLFYMRENAHTHTNARTLFRTLYFISESFFFFVLLFRSYGRSVGTSPISQVKRIAEKPS